MSVPKGKRSESKFEAQHHFYKLRDEVTKLVLNDFGFSESKYQRQMERYKAAHATAANLDEVAERWETKCETFKRWFVDEEGRAIIDILRKIQTEFTLGNSIFPSDTHAKLFEFIMRRHHINRAIGLCYTLKQEMQYAIRTLPVDINKFERFSEAIDQQIALYKGVRKTDNRLIKPGKDQKREPLSESLKSIFDSIVSIISIFKFEHVES